MSIAIALVGYVTLAVVGILDKFILTKTLRKPIVFAFYSSVFTLPILLLIPFGVVWPSNGAGWLLALVSGLTFAGGLAAMYKGFTVGEVSHMGPLVGAATPFFVVILGAVFLREHLSSWQLMAIGILIVGSVLISLKKQRHSFQFLHGVMWALSAGLLFSISHVAAKYMYDAYGFYSGFVWTRGAIGVGGILLLFSPTVRRSLFGEGSKGEKEKNTDWRKLLFVGADKALGIIGVVLVQYAIALGSVSIINALAGFQYAVLVILVALLSKFSPRVFRERYEPGEMRQEALAVAIIAAGLGIFLVK